MKLLLAVWLTLALCFSAGAANKAIHELNNGTPAQPTDLIPIDRPSWNNFYISVADLQAIIGGATNAPVYIINTTNLYAQSNFVYVSVVTNLYVSVSYTTNLTAYTITNNVFVTTNVTVNDSLVVQTNVTINQNVTVAGKATFNQVIITNGIRWVTNSWAGPTNTIDLGDGYDQNFSATSDVAITGFINKSNSITSELLLSVINTAATNITMWLPAGVADADYTLTHTITNGTTGMFWLRYTPQGPRTNCVFRQM